MRIVAAVFGDLEQYMEDQITAVKTANTAAISKATDGLKLEMRRQVKRAGMGERLSKTWRGIKYPKGGRKALEPAGIVYSKAHFMRAFEEGEVISAGAGKALAIPTDAVGRIGQRRLKPKDYPRGFLRVVSNGKTARLVGPSSKGKPTVYFILVRQVTLKKSIDFKRAQDQWLGKIPGYVVREWERASKQLNV